MADAGTALHGKRQRGRLRRSRPAGLSILCVVGYLAFFSICHGEEYTFDPAEIEKKPYHMGGFIEMRPALLWPDKEAVFYHLRYYHAAADSPIRQFDAAVQLDGSYERGAFRLFSRLNAEYRYDGDAWSDAASLYEGYLSYKTSTYLILEAGKKTLKWGKGYAWNPTAFVERPKDPDDPDLNREGFFMASADYTRSFDGALKTVSLSLALVPVYDDLNDDFGEPEPLNGAFKIYVLWKDTDIDLMALVGESKPRGYGLDFSRNLISNLEIHGELVWIQGFEKNHIDENGVLAQEKKDVWRTLLGLRYLSAMETTYIFEYYRNGSGFTEQEMNDFFAFVEKGYDRFLTSKDDALLRKAGNLAEGRYGKPNSMQDYLYARISQKEPLNILYFNPAVTGIFNLNDWSYSFSPELLYTGITNFEIRLKGTYLAGGRFTEYGEKQNDYRCELRIRYFF